MGPVATFAKWKERRRHVEKGEKAIALCQPVTVKRTIEERLGQPEEHGVCVIRKKHLLAPGSDLPRGPPVESLYVIRGGELSGAQNIRENPKAE